VSDAENLHPDIAAELEALARELRRNVGRRRRLGGHARSDPAAAGPPRAGGANRPAKTRARPAYKPEDVVAQAAAAQTLDELRLAVSRCEACDLCETRTKTVFQDGLGTQRILFVGEAPGADEDRTGVPFVGRAGQLLTDIITKGMGLERADVWIANVLKCRPPLNRDPNPKEKATCTPWLDRQIELLDPAILIALGRHAATHLLGFDAPLNSLRGRVHELRGRRVVATYHPAFLLRSPGEKKECWKDIQLAMRTIGLSPPPRT
jgi:DNA polymerase